MGNLNDRIKPDNRISAVAITGVTGMIGSTLARLFSADGVKVIGFVRRNSKKTSNIDEKDKNITIIECDIDEYGDIADSLESLEIKADVFFHFAWLSPFGEGRNNTDLQTANICYANEAVKLANKLGCHTFIGAGSQAEYGRVSGKLNADVPANPENGYGIAKFAAGNMTRLLCGQLGMRHVWARILSVYGPGDNTYTMVMSAVDEMLDGKKKSFTKGEQMWDFMYCEDCARAFMALAARGRDGGVYCLGSGTERPLKEYITIIRDTVNPDLELGLGEVPYADKQVMELCADIADLRADTGFEPATTFEEGIKKTVEWAKMKREKEKK